MEPLNAEMLEQLTLCWETWEAQAGTVTKKIARARLHLLFLLIRYGGLRLGEALMLNVREAVDVVTGMVRLPPPGARDILLPLSCMRHIRRILTLPEAADSGFLRFDQGYVRRKFYEVARELRLPSSMAGPRAIRYARGLELLRLHVPFEMVQAFLGQQKSVQIGEFLAFAGGEAKRIVRGEAAQGDVQRPDGNDFIGVVTAMEAGMRAVRVEVTTFSDFVIVAICERSQCVNMDLHLNQVVTAVVDEEQIVVTSGKALGSTIGLQGPFPVTVVSLHRDAAESFLVLELADGSRVNAVQDTVELEKLKLQPGSGASIFFPSRGVGLVSD